MMLMAFLKFSIAALAIAFSSSLAGKRPELAGFIIALPIASLLALAFSYVEYRDSQASIIFAKSILIGVPVSWLFFAPFFVADRLGLSFAVCYALGLALLVGGFFLHQQIIKLV